MLAVPRRVKGREDMTPGWRASEMGGGVVVKLTMLGNLLQRRREKARGLYLAEESLRRLAEVAKATMNLAVL